MPRYSISGKNKQTGRKRTRVYDARTETHARTMAEVEGTEIESVIAIPSDQPTERQLAYAKDLGIQVPSDVSKQEVSDLIDRCVNEDEAPDSESLILAERYEIHFTRFTGKREIASRIYRILNAPGKEAQLLAWFAFYVSIHLNRRKDHRPFQDPDDPFIQRIAIELAKEAAVVKSLRRYTDSDLREFGMQVEKTEDALSYRQGTTTRTIAFKRTVEKLSEYAAMPASLSSPVSMQKNAVSDNLFIQQNRGSAAHVHEAVPSVVETLFQQETTSKPWYKFW
jgi:hypothetical protein